MMLPPGRHRVRLPHDRGCRYLQVSFSGEARLHGIGIEEHLYPHDDVRRFTCSDPTLNRIWDAAVATLHSNSIWSHVDNARRERQGWAGPDLTLSSRGFMAAFGDTRLTRKQLEDYCESGASTASTFGAVSRTSACAASSAARLRARSERPPSSFAYSRQAIRRMRNSLWRLVVASPATSAYLSRNSVTVIFCMAATSFAMFTAICAPFVALGHR